jgi:hypothetical protein
MILLNQDVEVVVIGSSDVLVKLPHMTRISFLQ